MDNGLTQTQAAEAIPYPAFFAGRTTALWTLPTTKDIFEKRIN